MSVIPVALSTIAGLMSALLVLGIPAEVYTHSTMISLYILGITVAVLLTDVFFLPLFYRLQLTSINSYFKKRFDSVPLRTVTTISYLIGNFFYLGPVLYGPALTLSSVTPLSIHLSIIASGVICTFYTTLGGMKAVVWTDVMQMTILFGGMMMVAVKGTYQVGGLKQVFDIANSGSRLQLFRFQHDVQHDVPAFWEVFLGLLVLQMGNLATNQICIQRYCCVSSLKKSRLVLYLTYVGSAITVSLAVLCGLVVYANYHDCDPIKMGAIKKADQIMPYFVVEFFGKIPGLTGFFIAAVFSGSFSTISSVLNAMTVLTWNDLIKGRIQVKKSSEIIVIKLIGTVYGLAVIVIAYSSQYVGSIIQASSSLAGSLKGPLLAVFSLAILCPFITAKSLISGLLAGQAFCLAMNFMRMATKRVHRSLPMSTSGCPFNSSSDFSPWNDTFTTTSSTSHKEYNEDWLMNISPFFIPFMGNIVAIFIGLVVSYTTGCAKSEEVDHRFIYRSTCTNLKENKKPLLLKEFPLKEITEANTEKENISMS